MGLLAVPGPRLRGPHHPANSEIPGNVKLIVLAFGEDEFAIIDIDQSDSKPTARSPAHNGWLLAVNAS